MDNKGRRAGMQSKNVALPDRSHQPKRGAEEVDMAGLAEGRWKTTTFTIL